MNEEILSLRVWFLSGCDFGPDIKAQKDSQTGRLYANFRGVDAFEIARLLPQQFVELVTVRQELDWRFLKVCKTGVYEHGSSRIILEADLHDSRRRISVTAQNVDAAAECYKLFRQGKLTPVTFDR